MTTKNGIISLTVQDFDGEITAMPTFVQFDDGTEDFGTFATYIQNLMENLSPLLDGAIVKARLVVDYNPLGGDPASGAEIERTGLLSMSLTGVAGRSYGYDIPAFKYSKFDGNKIPLTDTDVEALVSYITFPVGSITVVNENWSYALGSARNGAKTFRKHRKQTKRT